MQQHLLVSAGEGVAFVQSSIATVPSSAAIREPSEPWFGIRCTGSPDVRVIPAIKARFGHEIYFPRIREMRPVPRKLLSRAQRMSGIPLMRPRVSALLPGTFFIRIIGPYQEIFELPSVRGFVTIGNRPAQIPDFEIVALRKREIDGVIAGSTPAHLILLKGDKVRIAEGALAMFSGTIERVPDVAIQDIDGETRLRIMIEMMGRETFVDVPAWQVEKLSQE